MSNANAVCACGTIHPAGFIRTLAAPAQHNDNAQADEHSAAALHKHNNTSGCGCAHERPPTDPHVHENDQCGQAKVRSHGHDHHGHEGTCGHAHDDTCSPMHESTCGADHADSHGHEHDHGAHKQRASGNACCCGHEALAPLGMATLGTASGTRAVYRIPNMDCPLEEGLIRKKLGSMTGITGLEFNLMQRVLTVDHVLSSTTPIEEALKSIDMTPEALGLNQGSVALFSVQGMDCPMEEALIKSKLSGMPGLLGLEFNLMQRTVKVHHAPSALPAISGALATLNMGATLLDAASEAPEAPATEIPWKKLAAAGVFAALSEGFELISEWQATPFGINPHSWTLGGYGIMEYLTLVFAVIAILLAGLSTYKKGWIAIRNFNLNINALMSVAVTGAVIIGQYPEAAMVMVLFNISEAIEAKALDRTRNAIKDLLALAPEKATVARPDGSWEEMDIRRVGLGSRVRVRPGERVALDGIILQGQSTINQAPITGESMPVEKEAGDTVYAGTINESGSFEFEVTATTTNSTLARIIHAVEEAQGSRAPIQRFVDKLAAYYTPAVFLAAILAAVVPPLFMGVLWLDSIYTALVLLVIGCPCALVISTPVSIVSGMAAATRSGILIKGGMFLEQGRLLNWLALDKTGTITHGKPRQTDFIPLEGTDSDMAVALAASIAGRSDHPVSRAIAEHAAQENISPLPVDAFAAVPGQGVSGVIAGEQWHLGSHRMVERFGLCSAALEDRIFALEKQGKTVVALMNTSGVQALFAVADTLKDSSVEAIAELRKLGVKTMMLTGDNEHTARAIAEQVGVDAFKGNLLPEDKLQTVELLGQEGKVGMVGDGINDAPALARADIGFAMAANGTDTAIETADVALMDDDLRKIPRFISLSRSTYAILIQNISMAIGVKAIFFALTFIGHATMWMAVFADMGTALLVVANGLRAMRK